MGLMDEYRPFVAYQYNKQSGCFYWGLTDAEMEPSEHRARARVVNTNAEQDFGELAREYFGLKTRHGCWLVRKIREIAPDGSGIAGTWNRALARVRYAGFMPTGRIRMLKALIRMQPAKFNVLMRKVKRDHSIPTDEEVPFAMMEKYIGEIMAFNRGY